MKHLLEISTYWRKKLNIPKHDYKVGTLLLCVQCPYKYFTVGQKYPIHSISPSNVGFTILDNNKLEKTYVYHRETGEIDDSWANNKKVVVFAPDDSMEDYEIRMKAKIFGI